MPALCALKQGCGLLALPAPRLHHGARAARSRLVPAAAKGKAGPPPAEAPAAAPAPVVPSDVPAYFQPAPPPTQQAPQVYQAVPQQYYAPPAQEPSFWSQIPPIVYIGVGVVLAAVLNKVMAVIKGGPAKMQEIAMQQMMNQMMKQMGSAQGGASPFGAAGANPFGAAGASPFGAAGASPFGAAGASPFGGAASGFPSSFPNMPPAFDTTATPAASTTTATSSSPSSSTTTASATPASSSSSPNSSEKPKKRSAFTDVNTGSSSSSSSGSGSSTSAAGAATDAAASSSTAGTPPPNFSMPPPPFNMPPPPAGGAAGSGTGAGGVANTMLDMLKNPEMQKMLYPYLPEPMRNPETFEWMLNNPEYRAQLEGMLQQQAMATGSPAVQEMMAGMDMNPEKMQAQFDQLGMTPDQFIQKVMGDPDLAGMMTNPKVMAAIAECTKNPMAIFNYQNDPEVLRVFEKMSTLFPQAAGGGMGMMPPGFGPPPTQQ